MSLERRNLDGSVLIVPTREDYLSIMERAFREVRECIDAAEARVQEGEPMLAIRSVNNAVTGLRGSLVSLRGLALPARKLEQADRGGEGAGETISA